MSPKLMLELTEAEARVVLAALIQIQHEYQYEIRDAQNPEHIKDIFTNRLGIARDLEIRLDRMTPEA